MNRFWIVCIALIVASCSGPDRSSTDRGSSYGFRDGYPELRISAVGFIDDAGIPSIQVVADVVKGSLIYKNVDGFLTAQATLNIQLNRLENRVPVSTATIQIPILIESDRPDVVRSSDIQTTIQNVQVDPGDYEILVMIQDASSNQQTTRRAMTSLPDPAADVIGLTGIRIFGVDKADTTVRTSITTFDVQNRYAAIDFEFNVVIPPSQDTVQLTIDLVRYESDTESAREMAGIPVSPGSIQYKGIEYGGGRKISTNTLQVSRSEGVSLVRHRIASPATGNFRLDISVPGPNDETLTKSREFSMKSAWYPNVRSVQELAEPLVYLMGRREHQNLMSIDNSDSLKNVLDQFWLENIKNRSRAGQVLELYYDRVEEANKQFSNFKEGWKTDMGMVYILFGPPWYVENSLDTSVWFYSYNRNDPRYTFQFYRPRIADQHFPFQHYVLQRDRMYHTLEYDMIQNWKSGYVLTNR